MKANKKTLTAIKLLQVDGDDGNGYYGTGYTIYVKFKKSEQILNLVATLMSVAEIRKE